MSDRELDGEVNDISNTFLGIKTYVTESEELFIFKTIKSFCEDVLYREISKKELEEMLLRAERMKWIPISERLPEEEKYILVSFANCTLPDIGRYEKDGEGGAFYPGDDEKSYSSYGLFVNAWMPLPEPYKGE